MGSLIQDYDSLNFLQRREEFCRSLLRDCDSDIEIISNTCKYVRDKTYANYIPKLKFLEMHELPSGEVTKTEILVFDGLNWNPLWNTRFINETEIIIEFDNLSFKDSLNAIYSVCEELIKLKIHFCLFGCLVETCPHIRIYDFLPEGLETKDHYLVRLLFCEKVVPEKYFGNLDKNMLMTGKTCCLEFAKHWRHGVMFRLLFEHIPKEVENVTT